MRLTEYYHSRIDQFYVVVYSGENSVPLTKINMPAPFSVNICMYMDSHLYGLTTKVD